MRAYSARKSSQNRVVSQGRGDFLITIERCLFTSQNAAAKVLKCLFLDELGKRRAPLLLRHNCARTALSPSAAADRDEATGGHFVRIDPQKTIRLTPHDAPTAGTPAMPDVVRLLTQRKGVFTTSPSNLDPVATSQSGAALLRGRHVGTTTMAFRLPW